ncbi:MAG: hypothetical protein GY852_08220 [bacterium]|nr:hypothetical protein [bacterium]
MALQFGYSRALSLENMDLLMSLIGFAGLALQNEQSQSSTLPDPKQVFFGVLMACFIMLFIMLVCVLVAYLALQALQSF